MAGPETFLVKWRLLISSFLRIGFHNNVEKTECVTQLLVV